MLKIRDDVDLKELKYKKKLYEKIFTVINKDLIPVGAYNPKCKKCKDMKETHLEHATEKELLKDKIAREFLKNISCGVSENEN